MGLKQIPTSDFLDFLYSLGIVRIRNEASHWVFNYPDEHPKGKLKRPLIVRIKNKDIPLLHIHSNLLTLNVSKSEFEKWYKGRLKGGKSRNK